MPAREWYKGGPIRLLLVTPNPTAAMTERIERAGGAAAARGREIIAVNPPDGPVSVEGYYDAAFSVPGLLAEIAKGDAAGVSAHIIACFDDTGLEAARCVASAPVIGIGEAAFHLAAMLGHRFSVVTTLSRSIAAIENNLLKYGLAGRCGKVRACELPVLSLDDPASNAAAPIGAEIELAKQEAQAARLAERHGLPVIDGVASAVKLAEAFGSLGLKTSKIGAYALPRPKPYLGSLASFAPR